MGLPWIISTVYHSIVNNAPAYVPAGNLGYSVSVFLCCSMVCFLVLLLRRCFVHGELGGPKNTRNASAAILVGLWLTYVTLCWIKAYRPMAFSPSGTVSPGELEGFAIANEALSWNGEK